MTEKQYKQFHHGAAPAAGRGGVARRRHQYRDWSADVRVAARCTERNLLADTPGQWSEAIKKIANGLPGATPYDVLRRPNVWLERLQAFKDQHGEALRWSMSDADICLRAKEIAAQVAEYLTLWPEPLTEPEQLDVVRMVCASIDVPEPVALTGAGAVARGVSDVWWRRVLRKKIARVVEAGAIKLGIVNGRDGAYCSDAAVARRVAQNKRNALLLSKTVMRNEAGQYYKLSELAMVSTSNPKVRGDELMTRIRGCEEYAGQAAHVGRFFTLTAPSRFHAMTQDKNKRPRKNKHYDGVSTPRDAQAWLCQMWARSRAELARMGLQVYGFRVAEPHHDSTPHWHALLWCRTELDAAMLEAVLRGHWLSDDGDERGAQQYRVDCKVMQGGGAAGYMSKYVAKNIGHYDVGDHIDTADGLTAAVNAGDVAGWQRVDAWASTWGIRQFQSFGQPPVSAWRELRRVGVDQIDQARVMDGDFALGRIAGAVHKVGVHRASWAGFVAGMGGVCLKREAYALQPAKRINQVVNMYGETVEQKKVVGLLVLRTGRWLISRRQAWVKVFDVPVFDPESRAAQSAPWTRFTNCTARLTGRLRAALLGASGPNSYRPVYG